MPLIGEESGYRFSDNSQDLITPNGNRWSFVKKLQGRGQAAFAAFYRDNTNNQTYLIKCDAPGVCLAEATATNAFLPEAYQTSINCADIGVLNQQTMTIQPLVPDAVPLDTIVYHKKRNPHALVSYELRYQRQIKDFLQTLTPEAKMDLAHSLFASTALGDESLHLGQFLALTDPKNKNQVRRIVRIDFGARERYAQARFEKNDFVPTETSEDYKKSGQFGKNYISFLLANPSLRGQFLILWAKSNVQDIVKKQIKKFQEQLSKLPEEQGNIALAELLQDINKHAKHPHILSNDLTYQQKISFFLEKYEDIILDRCINMRQRARQELGQLLELPLINDQDKILYRFLTQKTASDILQIEKLLTQIKNRLSSENLSYADKKKYHRSLDVLETHLAWEKNQQQSCSSTAGILQQFSESLPDSMNVSHQLSKESSLMSQDEVVSVTTSEDLSSDDFSDEEESSLSFKRR